MSEILLTASREIVGVRPKQFQLESLFERAIAFDSANNASIINDTEINKIDTQYGSFVSEDDDETLLKMSIGIYQM